MKTAFTTKISRFVLTCALFIGIDSGLPSLSAEPLVKWDFSGEDGTQIDPEPKPSPSQVAVSGIIRGEGFSPGKASAFTQDGMCFASTPNINSLEDAMEKDAYFEITLTPAAGQKLTIDTISFSSRRASKVSGPNNFVVRSSLDDFESDLTNLTSTLPVNLPEGGDVELSFGGGLSEITQPVTLRFYGFGRNQPDNPDGGLWVIGNHSAAEGLIIDGHVTK